MNKVRSYYNRIDRIDMLRQGLWKDFTFLEIEKIYRKLWTFQNVRDIIFKNVFCRNITKLVYKEGMVYVIW